MKIPEPESLKLSRVDLSISLATLAAYLVLNVFTFVFPLNLRGGGSTVLATTYSRYQRCPGPCPGENTPAPPQMKTVYAGI